MSSNSSIFSGSSRYAADFQSVIDRAVAIASLPKTQLESQKTELTSQSTALDSIDTKFESLQATIASLSSVVGTFSSAVSDSDVASATTSSGALKGTYSFEVVDIGAYSYSMSSDAATLVEDPSSENISSSDVYTLTVDGEEFAISLTANTLSDLAGAINLSGADVEATIVNVGSSSAPDYRLSVRSNKLGNVPVQLNDGSSDLMDPVSTGSLASYKVNGGATLTSDSRTLALAPGLSVTMKEAGTTSITVSPSTQAISNALSALVSAYNSAVDELDTHRGEDAGALKGSSLLYTLSDSLRSLGHFETDASGVGSLADLGLEFDQSGKLAFNTTTFSTAATDQYDALAAFLGTSSTDGFLKFATDTMTALEDSTDGVITLEQNSLTEQIAAQDAYIADEQRRIDDLEVTLTERMGAADAAIAALEQQVNYFNGLFAAMQSYRDSLNA